MIHQDIFEFYKKVHFVTIFAADVIWIFKNYFADKNANFEFISVTESM